MRYLKWLMVIVFLFLLCDEGHCFGNKINEGGHDAITRHAAELVKKLHPGDRTFDYWLSDEKKGALNNFITGAHDEDCTLYNAKVPLSDLPIGPNCESVLLNCEWGNFFEHFYNPLTGQGFWSLKAGGSRPAPSRAEDYQRAIKKLVCSSGRYTDLSDNNRSRVNDYFGRILHLLQDMGMSYHTKVEPHIVEKPLEMYVQDNWAEIAGSTYFQGAVSVQGYGQTNYSPGRCIDPTVAMRKLALWSNVFPADRDYYDVCRNDPPRGLICQLNQEKLSQNATLMSAEATLFTTGYIDQIWRAINSDCICEPPISGPGRGQPDDTFSVNGSYLGTTQLDLSATERLDFFLRLALKKGDVSPLYTKQLMEIYGEARALPPSATQETKDEIQARFQTLLNILNNLPTMNQNEWADIALHKHGFHEEALTLINAAKEPIHFVNADVDPSVLRSYPSLVIPSGGLMGLEKSALFKGMLDEYVKNGGTLIVFSQPYGYHFSILPVPAEQDGTTLPVNGFGWEEDQNCFTDAVYFDTWHTMFSGQSRSTPTINVDGYFTVYPSTAKILLRRTANGQPAMLSYEHGQGRVIVTSLYSDFAFGQSQASTEERALVRDMISWAKNPTEIPEVRRGETIFLTLNVANHMGADAASTRLLIYNPDRSMVIGEQIISGTVPAHGQAQIVMQFAAPSNAQLGIYHVDYVLLDNQGTILQPQTETDSGRLALSAPPANPYKSPDFNFSATTNTERVLAGEDVVFTVHAWNNTQRQRTITAKYVFPHMYLITKDPGYGVFTWSFEPGKDDGWLTKTFTINSSGRTSFDHVMRNAQHDEFIFANFYDENNRLVGRAQRGFFLFHPSVEARVLSNKNIYLQGETIVVNAEFTNLTRTGFSSIARIHLVDGSGRILAQDERAADIPAYGVTNVEANFFVSHGFQRGNYAVIAILDTAFRRIKTASTSFKIESNLSRVSVTPNMPYPLRVGWNNISFTVHNDWLLPINHGRIEIDLHDPSGSSVSQNSSSFALVPQETKVITIPTFLPELLLGDYFFYYTKSDETQTGGPARITIPSNVGLNLTMDRSVYRAGETLAVSLGLHDGDRVNFSAVDALVTIPDLGLSETRRVSIPVGEWGTSLFTFSLPPDSPPGTYRLTGSAVLPSGARESRSINFSIPQPSLILTVPGSRDLVGGSPLRIMVENAGGTDTSFTGTISIGDKDGIAIYEADVDGSIRVGETRPLADITIPPQAAQGRYVLTVLLEDHVAGSQPALKVNLDVTGATAHLQTRSVQDVYLQTESVSAVSDLVNGSVVTHGGNLRVEVSTFGGQPGFAHFLPKTGWLGVEPLSITISSDGSIYISEACRILHLDASWNLIEEWGSCGTGNGQFNGATCLAVGTDGSVYVVDSGNHRVQRFTSYGAFLQAWGQQGYDDGQFRWPTDLAIGPDGTIYVSDTSNNRIQKFSADGAFLRRWGFYGTGNGNFSQPAGLSVGLDGSVYVVDSGNHRIQRFTPDGSYVAKWGTEGAGDGQFFRPQALTVGVDGSVYVGNNHRIQRFTADGVFISRAGDNGMDIGQFLEVASLAAGPDGTIYAVDSYNNDIQRFDSNLGFISHWGSHSNQNGWFYHPSHLAISPDGSLYVSDNYNNRIQKFTYSGDFIASWGSEGSGNGEFNYPAGVAVSPEGSVFVADYYNHRIQKFTSEGRFVMTWGGEGTEDGKFSYPYGLAVNNKGEVYVADRVNNRIQKFDAHGTFITKWSAGMSEGIAIGSDGSVYTFDYVYYSGWSKHIQRFDENGTLLNEWEWWSTTYSGAIAVDEEGHVYLADGAYIHRFDSNGNCLEQREVPGACWDLVFARNGTMFCADTDSSRILKYQPSGGKTVFERNIPLTLNPQESRAEITQIGTLGESGKYFLNATLTSSLGQKLAQSEYPFYVAHEDMILKLSPNKTVYKPDEIVTIQGEIQNLTHFALQGLSFALNQQTGSGIQPLYSSILDVPAGGSYPFTVTTQAGSEGLYRLVGAVNRGDSRIFETNDRYEVFLPSLTVNLTVPDVAGPDSFTISLEIKNDGKFDATFTLTSPFDSQIVTVPRGTSYILTYPNQQIREDRVYTFILSGDVSRTISRAVSYGLASTLAIQSSEMYQEGPVAIPITIKNVGSLDAAFPVSISLEPSGLISQRSYYVPQGQIASDTVLFDLTEGNYTLTLASQTHPATTQASFSVRKEDAITLAPIVIHGPSGGLITASSEITNRGYRAIEGTVELSVLNSDGSTALQSVQAVSLPADALPAPVPINLSFSPALLQPGSYTVKIALLNGGLQELASQTIPLVLTGASLRLSQVPSSLTVTAGEEATFAFGISNSGGKEASAELTFKSHDFINLTRRELMNPGEEKTVQFSFTIPADLEEKDYYGEYELKGENGAIAKGQIKYHVTGIHISVAASLDKDNYREGETARLAMTVNQQGGGGSRNFFARVNYGDHEGKQVFSLSGSQNLSFDIPLTAITGEKLFYGVYDEGGRSIHLNSLYIYKTGDAFTITTNKQVYNQGEPVIMTITGTAAGTMSLSAPGPYEETFPFSGSATKSFVLPAVVRAGTYFIEAGLTTAGGETLRMTKPFDIAGISVKVKEAVLDKGKYAPGDAFRLSMRIESNSDMPATMKVWTVDPSKNSTFLGERGLSLTRAEQTIVSADYPPTITISGIHKVIYGIYSDRLLLSSGNLSFDAGDGVILGIATDRNEYPLGSETVAVRLNLYGTTEATLTLNVNGAAVHTEALSLNGFTTPTIQLPMPGPGAHTLEGILAAGGLSSTKETKFLYGTNLPDLTADVWGSGTAIGKDGRLKLTASAGNRGKTATTQTLLTLHDGDILLTTFPVGELAAGSSQSHEFLWNVLGKAGEHTLAATVDPQNALTEFTKENNRVTRRIVVPDIALITETDKESYRTGEQVTVNATTINLTAATNYPNLTCTTIVRDPSGTEAYRQSSSFSLAPSQSTLVSATWNTGSLAAEGRYTIRQEIASGTGLLAEKTKTVNITVATGFALRVEPSTARIKQGETALFTVSVDVFAGWNGSVTLEAEGIPAGTTAALTPGIVGAPGNSILSIVTSDTTPPGTYALILRGLGDDGGGIIVQAIPVTLEISGFTLQVEPENISIAQQETAAFTVRAASLNGYEGSLVLSDETGRIRGLIVIVANPGLSVPDGETAVRVESSKYSLPGTYTIKISGNDGIITKDVNLPVVVAENAGIAPGFVMTPGPGYDNRALVSLMNRNFVEQLEFTAFNTRFGANAVMGDIDGDGEDEIIVAPGPDPSADGRVRIFRKNGVMLLDQPVFTTKFGATLAVGDIDGDWREEVVVGAGPGLRNTARVKVLSFDGQRLSNTGIDFVAFPDAYKLGVKLALGDVDGDGILDIIAGAGPSPLNRPRVKVFKIDTSGGLGRWRIASTLSDFTVNFGDWYPYFFGVNVAAGDVDGDGMAEIIAGAGPNPLQKAVVAVYKGDGTFTGTRFEAYPSNVYRFGVNVAARDLDGDGIAEIITGPGPSPFSDSWVRVFKGDGTLLSDGLLAFPKAMKFGVKVSTGNVGE